MKVFYFNEIVKFAIEKEQESINLYQSLVGVVSDPKAKQLFEKLVIEEQHHKSFYSDMLSQFEHEKISAKETDEYDEYMKQLISESRKNAPVTKLCLENIQLILDYAIAREKDSVVFYAGLKNFVADNMHAQINEIIKEETKHAIMLVNLKKQLG